MRSYRSFAVILTLIMLLLVLAAGFVFLFQAELRLRDQVRAAQTEVASLSQRQAELELQVAAEQGTREAAVVAAATAEQEGLLLEGQLVESQQAVDELTAEVGTLTAELEQTETGLAELQEVQRSRPPLARIIAPAEGAVLQTGREVEIVIAAGDPAGLETVAVLVDEETLGSYQVNGETFFSRAIAWQTPATEGEHTLSVTAVNVNGVSSEPAAITVDLSDLESRNAAIRAEVEGNVVELRGLEPLEPIAPVVLSRDELRERVEADFAEDTTPEETRADVLTLSGFDFLARDFDLYNALVELRSEGVLGFYDPETAEFVVVSDDVLLSPAAQWTHAHEFMHALQDQYYALETITDESLDSEARAALRALAEGEAELLQYLYIQEGFFNQSEIQSIIDDQDQGDDNYLDKLPPILISDLAFPYTAGFDFARSLYESGGFDALDAAWRNPPRSTEQILHLDRYLAGDEPEIVGLPPLTDTLGVGWEKTDEDILGEFYLREYLAQQLSQSKVDQAATGWGGDRLAVYWNETDQNLVMVVSLVWDTVEDATQFAAVYPEYPAALFEVEGVLQADGSTCWPGDETICFFSDPAATLIVRAPDLDTAVRVMAALRRP